MAFLIAAPDMLSLAATEVAGIGESVSAAHAVAASSTTAVVAAAGDEVSTAIAGLFSRHAQQFAALAAQAVGFHDQFVQALTAAGGAYAGTEAANVSPLQTLENDVLAVINAPTNALLGRPLIGNGADGASGVQGQPGAPGWPCTPLAPSAPLPINGRPSNALVGALITASTSFSRVCSGDTLAASVPAYAPPAAVSACTNWS
ncbi:PE family protein [Mycobacterium palustre]|uniref:PE family protein n=1 Tax=Mycobacterium palustre TaxID=153971 RepID=UPI000A155FA1